MIGGKDQAVSFNIASLAIWIIAVQCSKGHGAVLCSLDYLTSVNCSTVQLDNYGAV